MSYRIGIDLGTTFSVISYVDEHGKPKIIKNAEGKTTTPSVIYFGGTEPIVGDEAKERQAFGDTEVASFFKRSMGDDSFVEFFNDQEYSATDLAAIVLKKLKKDAEAVLGGTVNEAVITVPAYFENKQRLETMRAGEMAGLKVSAIINEPTAASLAYGIDQSENQTLIVYDLGGGTFDVTIVEVSAERIRVLATAGDHSLGGKDWDDRIVSYVTEQFEEIHGIDPLANFETMNDLIIKGEQAKKTLTTRSTTSIPIVCNGVKDQFTISRELFEELTEDLLERTWSLTNQALIQADLLWDQVSNVLLVGGSTRMPMVSDYIQAQTGSPPLNGVHPDEAVALGAAIQAEMSRAETKRPKLSLGGQKKIEDVMSHSLGMIAINKNGDRYLNSIILPKNVSIPSTRKKTYQIETNSVRNNSLEVYTTQGESNNPLECTIVGKYKIQNIPHNPNGLAVLEVSYSYDANGVVQVSAEDKSSGVLLPAKEEEVPSDLSWLSQAPKQQEEVLVKPPLSVCIALDLSGSMAGAPLAEAQQAAREFINKLDFSNTTAGLIGFSDRTLIVQDMISDPEALNDSIDRYSLHFHQNDTGFGNLAEPFTDTVQLLKDKEGHKFLIVLTDGLWSNQTNAIKQAKACHDEGIEVIAVGFGSANKEFLTEIATSEESALFTNLTELVESFSKIAQVLSDQNLLATKKKAGGLRIFR
ncbi:Hsp70 family protein [Alkalihalobacterium chitinilyticum]|uniref:Chaperone protein DnaK n=1 Tax=Alkalihalobacterium chitinilyticum TaxID=2980103 RepID=A0ABT5VH37_9BACI|nr:Hsp70 family protein [Alkalihalobacterium chitinilyticum]MDE5414057.1 Hsp70 family protein [Alkalihalobacterium chitinilyticum]